MKLHIDKKEFGLFIEHDQIKKRTRLIGTQINVAYEKQVPVFIGVLNGSFMFMADLMKEIEIAAEICFIKLASYDGMDQSDKIQEIIGLCVDRSEEHTSELQSRENLVCRLLLEKKKQMY